MEKHTGAAQGAWQLRFLCAQDGAHPAEDAIVVCEAPDDAGDVRFQALVGGARGVGQGVGARRLDPPGVVHPGRRAPLRPERRERVPAAVEQHQQRADLVPVADAEELLEADDEPVLERVERGGAV